MIDSRDRCSGSTTINPREVNVPLLGLDLSLCSTGLAVWVEGRPVTVATVRSTAVTHGGAGHPRRWNCMWDQLATIINDVPPGVALIEGLAYGIPDSNNLADLASLRAVVTDRLWHARWRFVDHRIADKSPKKKRTIDPSGRGIAPTTIKRYALGKGVGPETGKDAMVLAARTMLDHIARIRNNDEADALWLLAIGADLAGHTFIPHWPKRNRDALNALRWPLPPTNGEQQ